VFLDLACASLNLLGWCSVVDSKTIQLYEKRIDRCYTVMDRCKEGSWAHQFWMHTATALLHKLNLMLGEDRYHEVYVDYNDAGKPSNLH
jgi:hypothetical protein